MKSVGTSLACTLVVAVVVSLWMVRLASATILVVPSPATPTIASALATAATGDTVNVLPGTYFERGLFMERSVLLRGVAGAGQTIINAEGLNRVIGIGDFAELVVIEGLTITNGAASDGAGIYAPGPVLALTIRGCVITKNHGSRGGGILFGGLGGPPLTIVDTVLSHNSAGNVGGALLGDNLTFSLTRCVFLDNTARSGGGAFIRLGNGSMTDCVFVENTATLLQGGGLDIEAFPFIAQGCTFYGNAAPLGGAIASEYAGQLVRTIVAATSTPPGHAAVTCAGGFLISCCDFFGNLGGNALCGTDGGGNFSLDPLFCDAAGGNFRLNENSPCLPGHHPNGVDCGGTIGALGVGCGVGTGVGDGIETGPWSRLKGRFR